MHFHFQNLDDLTRKFMHAEVELDINHSCLYLSPRLNVLGLQQYPKLLMDAVASYDPQWLAEQLSHEGLLAFREQRRTKNGYTIVDVPVTAADTLAEGEFNRYYIRGLCLRAIEIGATQLEVYRGKAVDNPRYTSESRIGNFIEPQLLLADLRNSQGVETALGLPAGPNSGLTVRLPVIVNSL